MDAFYSYTYGTATWLSIQALPLILMPKLIISLLATEAHYATDPEVYFSRSLGFSLLIVAVIILFFTGTIPISSAATEGASPDDPDPKSPYAVPIVGVTALHHTIGLIYCHVRFTSAGQTGYLLGELGYGAFACMGLWCVMFGTDSGKVSKRTGKDKRMVGFPFTNVNDYDKRKDKKMG